jgi:hypothetical protein
MRAVREGKAEHKVTIAFSTDPEVEACVRRLADEEERSVSCVITRILREKFGIKRHSSMEGK